MACDVLSLVVKKLGTHSKNEIIELENGVGDLADDVKELIEIYCEQHEGELDGKVLLPLVVVIKQKRKKPEFQAGPPIIPGFPGGGPQGW